MITKHTEATIQRALWRDHFRAQDYKLLNSDIYGWECDFFSVTGSGYAQEVEVKISRSDFKADFKKPKHVYFKALRENRTKVAIPFGRGNGDLACVVRIPEVYLHRGFGAVKNGSEELKERQFDARGGYIVNDWKNRLTIGMGRTERMYFPASRIYFHEVKPGNLPHQFWYAVPTGLVSLEEIPSYAGLIYVDDSGKTTLIKKAPYLHKEKQDLTRKLLHRYYNLWLYKVGFEDKMNALIENK